MSRAIPGKRGTLPEFHGVAHWQTDDPDILPFNEIVRLLAKYRGPAKWGRQVAEKSVVTREAIAAVAGIPTGELKRIADGNDYGFGRMRRRQLSRVLMDLESGELQWQIFGRTGRLVRMPAPVRKPDMKFRLAWTPQGRPTIEPGAAPPVKKRMPSFRDFSLPKG